MKSRKRGHRRGGPAAPLFVVSWTAPKVKAIVVTGKSAMFCGGAEITEFAVMVAMGPEKMKENNPVAALSDMMGLLITSNPPSFWKHVLERRA